MPRVETGRASPARRGTWAVFPLLLALPGAAPAAEPRFARLSVEEGLSHNTVRAILQDQVGFLWFATEEGLSRYDGHAFLVFRHSAEDRGSLPDDIVSALLEDRQGRFWVGTAQGLSLFDRRTETFSLVLPTRGSEVSALIEGPDGTLWVATEGIGLHRRDPRTGAFVSYRHDAADADSLASDFLTSLRRDRSGRIWVGTLGAGLDRLEEAGKGFRHHRHDPGDPRSLSHDDVWSLAEDADGRLWVATRGGGLNVLDPAAGGFRHYRHRPGSPRSLRTDQVTCLFHDRSGALWIGTDGAGLHRYDPATDGFVAFLHDPADPDSLSRNVVRTVYQDVQGQIWVGTFTGGANLLRTLRHGVAHYAHDARSRGGLGAVQVKSFLEDKKGRIWVGTEGGIVHRFDRQTGAFAQYRYPRPVFGGLAILSLLEDRQGRIWVGTYRGGLGLFDPERGTFHQYRHRPGDPRSLADDEVWALAEGEDGTLWVGTNNGLDRFDPARGVVERHGAGADGLSHVRIRVLHRDSGGNLWIGTLGGLNLLRPGSRSFVHYLHEGRDPRSLSHDWVMAIYEDRQRRLWLGTYGGGLNRLDRETGRFTAYKRSPGLPSDAIFGVLEGSSGRLWLSTNRGLARFDPATEQFDALDLGGRLGLQFNQGACLRTRDGRLMFGSVNGFYLFDPDAVQPDPWTPPVVLTGLRLFNEPVKLPAPLPALGEITLSHADKVLSLDFAALDYSLPRRNQYAYRLEGFSDQWVQLREKREVTFTNLDPGSYLFRVKASNRDGVWSEKGAALRIVIRPPFWGTWWFRALLVAAVLLGSLTVHRARVRHLRRRERELELRVEEALGRVRILKGLIPMCAWCKKIRDDQGYWSQVETYIAEHTEADFSHGICPECAKAVYRDEPGRPSGGRAD